MRLKQIYAISGKGRNGKDCTADIMMKILQGKSTKVSLARDLKYICKDYLGWDGTKDGENRNILIDVGTKKIRNEFGWSTFHVHRAYETIKIIEDAYDYIYIPDCRFVNEIRYLQAMFPNLLTTIRVERLNFESPLTLEQQQSETETSLDNFTFDYYIKSESGLDNLEKEIVKTLFPRKRTIQPSEPDCDPPMRL
jgi:hypothetical protein